jgi:TPR repeat protein
MRQLTRSNDLDSGTAQHRLLSLCLSLSSAILLINAVPVFANPSLRETLPAAQAGDARAHEAAVSLYQRSAAGGLADGNCALAYMYEFGLGVRVDRQKALFYYDRAAAKGSDKARQAAANLRSPDYDRPPQQNSGTEPTRSDQYYSCIAHGGISGGQDYNCVLPNGTYIDPSTGKPR